MLKTGTEIEGDFYTLIKESPLGQAIRGRVYRPDMRPAGAKSEDIVVKLLSGRDQQLQTGVVVVNIYIPDIVYKNGRRVRDIARIGEMEALLRQFIDEDHSEYWFDTEQTPTLIHHTEIDQYCLNVRLAFEWVAA